MGIRNNYNRSSFHRVGIELVNHNFTVMHLKALDQLCQLKIQNRRDYETEICFGAENSKLD